MSKIKPVTYKQGNVYCHVCRNEGKETRAAWMQDGRFTCEAHKPKPSTRDDYMTEADYQTWGRL